MIPISLTISGFLSYRDQVKVNFDRFDLACIAGANGAGKSSLLDAITWALFGKARKSDDSIINSQSTAASVSFVFAYEHNLYRVERSKPRDKVTTLEFQICHQPDGGQPVWRTFSEHTVRETNQRIIDTLRMDYETFVNASFFLQGKADQFTQNGPGDRKRILGSILGLDIWEQYKTRTGEQRKAVETEISIIDGSLREIVAEIAEEPARIERLQQLEKDLHLLTELRKNQEKTFESARREASWIGEQERRLTDQKRNLNTLEQRLAEMNRRLAERQKSNADHTAVLSRAEAIEAAYADWTAARAVLEGMERSAERHREIERARDAATAQIQAAQARLEQELATLSEAAVKIEAEGEDIATLTQEIQVEDERIRKAEERLKYRVEVEEERRTASEQHAMLVAEKNQLEIKGRDLTARVDRLKEAEGAECPLCGQPLLPEERLALVQRLEAEREALRSRYTEITGEIQERAQAGRRCEDELTALREADAELQKSRVARERAASRREALEQKRSDWEANGKPQLARVQAALNNRDFEPEERRRLAELDAKLSAAGYDPVAHNHARAAEESGRGSEAELRRLESARSAHETLEREINALVEDIQRENSDLEDRRRRCAEDEAALEQRRATAIDPDEAEKRLFDYREQENRLIGDVGSARQRVDVLEDRKRQKKNLEKQRQEYAIQVARYKQLERAFGKDGVPALLIEQALPEIETRANDILDRLSDGSMTVRFVTQERFKDRKREDLKETLGIEISDGAGQREYELFSGGEAFRVNFAVRLALSQILAQRAGAQLQTLVIDEGFGSQDLVGRQRLIEAINMVRNDFAKILVITHIDELKDAFPNRIEVEKTDRGSAVRVL